MNFGFLIDNRKCIGCHACSTACKSENAVPLGVNRTWVKYTEKGAFPDTRRYFQVTRCNHCANPPCVHICPTAAMFQRPDGIVEFNRDICIGCKACMQACPYDAIYIDPDTHTAAKCHFCAHRTEVGLEPACVVVCPEHAILAGDLSDPRSEISRALAAQPVHVRKPEQGTQPKLFYIDAEESAIVPGLARHDGLLWATWPDPGAPGAAVRDWRGPIQIDPEAGSMAGALLRSAAAPRETYTVPHRIPWHWQVPAYLVTKAVGAGAFLVGALGMALVPAFPFFTALAPLVALLGIGLTTALLVWDLDRPERFWTILIRPQWRSWLARGAFILIGFSAVAGLYFLAYNLGAPAVAGWLLWPGIVLAGLSAVYTAFLFGQAEGRDLWQSTLLPWHLLVQAVLAGAAALLVLGAFTSGIFALPAVGVRLLGAVLGLSALASLLLTVGGEFGVKHASQVASAAAHLITHGRYRGWYWFSLVAGLVAPMLLVVLAPASRPLLAVAGGLALAGLFAYEWAFVMAPQQIPNS
jgi:Fe-S-cluster-containing dehydrogenase component/formate-dependent nitrite reductase membrane component NrfD